MLTTTHMRASCVALSILLGLAVKAEAEIGMTDKDILIGVPNVTSGPAQDYGTQTNIGIRALIESVNAEGGVHGRKIALYFDDDTYQPDGAELSFQHMLDRNVFGITGLVGSVCLAHYFPRVMHYKMPAVGFYPGPRFVTTPTKRYVFATRAPFEEEMRITVDRLWTELGVRKISVIYQNDSFGADCLQSVEAALQKHDSHTLSAASYERNLNNVSEAFNQVKNTQPEAVILASVWKPTAEILKLAQQTDWHPIFVINSGPSPEPIIKAVGAAAENVLVTEICPPPTRTDLPAIAKYRQALKRYFPSEQPNYISLQGFIDALVFVEGLKRAGRELTREKFVNALESMHDTNIGLGKSMQLDYSPEDHMGLHNIVFGVIKNGQVEAVSDWKSVMKPRVPMGNSTQVP